MNTWYEPFYDWVQRGECWYLRSGIQPFEYYVDPEQFYPCLFEFFEKHNKMFDRDIIFSDEADSANRRILGYRLNVNVKAIREIATDGPRFLEDVRHMESTFGFNGLFSYAPEYLDFEQYVIFDKETRLSILLSIAAVAAVIFVVTFNLKVTLMVFIGVILADMFLVALIHYWGLTINSIVVVNIIVMIGFAVDYSIHIVFAYLTVNPPKLKIYKTDEAKRDYKAKFALSRIGSGVFHGGLALFLAMIVLSFSKSYIYTVFYKMWFGIIIFGMMNGLIFMPVVLSFFGPVDKFIKKKKPEESVELPIIEAKPPSEEP